MLVARCVEGQSVGAEDKLLGGFSGVMVLPTPPVSVMCFMHEVVVNKVGRKNNCS